MKKNMLVMLPFLGISLLGTTETGAQEQKWRNAFGDMRASVVEALSRVLFPSATLKWGYEMQLVENGSKPVRIKLPGYVQLGTSQGWKGVTGLEVGEDRKDFAKKTAEFQEPPLPQHPSEIVVFRADTTPTVSDYKRVKLDASEPVTEIDDLNILNWPEGKWPVVRVAYHSYYPGKDVVAGIGWEATLDTQAGVLLAKRPTSIGKRTRAGAVTDMLATRDTVPGEIEIQGATTKKTVRYSCGSPCVVNGATLLAEWPQ